MSKKVRLILENGKVFEGLRFGAKGNVSGEIIFSTNMTNDLGLITDPSFYGQMLVQTFPIVGNVGVIPFEFESENSYLQAYIVREWCQEPSNFRNEGNLDAFLKSNNIVGIYDIDTRSLTRTLRKHGTMNALITSKEDSVENLVNDIKEKDMINAVSKVTCKQKTQIKQQGTRNIVIWDFGVKNSTIENLKQYDCKILKVPANTSAKDILQLKPDGMILSTGPGNPKDCNEIIKQIKIIIDKNIPLLGIGLGHQLIALAMGAKTYKLNHGHRGSNQPVRHLQSNRVFITCQNHGYAVSCENLPEDATITFENINDNTIEGLKFNSKPLVTAQFDVDSNQQLFSTGFLYDDFFELIG